MEKLADELPLSAEVKEALLGQSNSFHDLLEIVVAYEKGEWEQFNDKTARHPEIGETMPELYEQSRVWARHMHAIQ